jgi:hypothetical protein
MDDGTSAAETTSIRVTSALRSTFAACGSRTASTGSVPPLSADLFDLRDMRQHSRRLLAPEK